MVITKYKSGRESYDFKIDRRQLLKFLSSVVETSGRGSFWLATTEGEQLRIMTEEANG